ncbi:MAG: hypothetical protein WC243_00490 [Patescibacteria group bacterium]|jgi:hypothetical protein
MKKYIFIWAIFWVVVYAIVSKTGYPDAATGVLGAAALSLFFVIKIIGSSWSGEVMEIKTEHEYRSDDDGGHTRDIDYAYVKLANGKVKKIQDLGWKVGDKLARKSGQFKPKLVS